MRKVIIIYFVLISAASLVAQTDSGNHILVGTKTAEPFTYLSQDSTWSGLAFDLWREIADANNITFDIIEYDLEDMLQAVADGKVDIAVAPITITAEREAKFDFSHPFFLSGMSIAVKNDSKGSFINTFLSFFSIEFLEVIFLLSFVLFIAGFLVWLFERKKNKDQFGTGKMKGLGHSFWFAAVTMTTVGYGDKAPITLGGRIIALIWMFAGIIIISSFTAAITTSLTVNRIDSGIKKFSDLFDARVGTVESSSTADFLTEKQVNARYYGTLEEGMMALENGRLDAFVYDEPLIKYYIKKQDIGGEISSIPVSGSSLYYGFAFPSGSKLREEINILLLQKLNAKESMDKLMFQYFGK